jgi:hypothetical protein
MARAWFGIDGSTLPVEVQTLLESHASFGRITSWQAEPEAKLKFDGFPGEPRNSDLLAVVDDSDGSYIVAVEAKADETFGETIEEALTAALDRKSLNPRSKGIARIEQLLTALLHPISGDLPAAKSLRYQLFTATAGALCEAERRGLSRTILLVHEFVTGKTDDERHHRNASDLDAFVVRISGGAINRVKEGRLCGPIQLPGRQVEFFIGKVVRRLR